MTPIFFTQPTADCDAAMQEEIVALWQTVFGDDAGFIRTFLAQAGAQGFFFVKDEVPRLCAMLFRLPLTADNRTDNRTLHGGYLYAVATAPDFRGRGLCRRLLALAEEGMDFLMLIPADDRLYDTYRRLSYTDCLHTRFPIFVDFHKISALLLTPLLLGQEDTPLDTVYADMCRYLPSGELLRSEAFFRLAVADYGLARLKDGGWLVFDKTFSGNTIKIYEMYCPFALFSAIIKQYGSQPTRFGLLKRLAPALSLAPEPKSGLYLQ